MNVKSHAGCAEWLDRDHAGMHGDHAAAVQDQRHRQGDRDTERLTDRETEQQRDRKTDTGTASCRHRNRNRQTGRKRKRERES